ncbi:MAG: F-box/WD repeat-containing protein [Verrucomicrobia bacterium]|nr:F-box/WD repeat-containing protein [Verrucomicrobiota bacterium]
MSCTDSVIKTSTHNTGRTTLQPPAPQNSGLVNLPPDLLIKILRMLPIQQLGSLNQTCRQMYLVTSNNTLILLLSQHFPNFPITDPDLNELEALKEQYLINSNLPKGVYASHTFPAHSQTVSSIALIGQTLYSSSHDKSIKIWDLKTNTCTATLQGHTSPIYCLAFDEKRLFSGSSDNTIKIWDVKTNQCTATLEGHTGPVYCLAFDGQKLISGSSDRTIKIWDLETNTCTTTLQGAHGGIQSLALDGQSLISGSNGEIKIWDLKTNQCTATLPGHFGPVYCLAFDGQKLISGSADRTIKIWDLNKNTCTATLQGHRSSVHALAIDGQRLFSGAADGKMKIWDLNTNACTASLKAPNSFVTRLTLSSQKLISASERGVIKIWDFNASDHAVFQEIAELIKSADHSIANDAMARFNNMPPGAKNSIYGELYQIMAPFANDYFGCAEHAFHNQHGQSSTPEQRAQAILNYLAKRS